MNELNKYRVHLYSTPGMWTFYEGHVDVVCQSQSEAFRAAVRKLARTSFPDRPGLDSWRLERIEVMA